MIIIRIYEGLGNQMFQYAYAFALGKRMKKGNVKIYLDMRENEVSPFDRKRFSRPLKIDDFNITLPIAKDHELKHWNYIKQKTFFQRRVNTLSEKGFWKYRIFVEDEFNFQKEYLKIKDNSYVVGWFQHYQYFERYRNELLKEFVLKEAWETPRQIRELMESRQVISIHVRRGDYVTNPVVRKSIGLCGKEYYLKAVDFFKRQVKEPYFLIFTNDEKWVVENISNNLSCTIVSNHFGLTDVQEMLLMSQCNHNIISNSTFSWWGAWLNIHEDKIVVAPRRWFRDKKRDNIAMRNWIQI